LGIALRRADGCRHPSHTLRLLHVDEQALSAQALQQRIAQIDAICRKAGIALQAKILRPDGDVFATLQAGFPAGPEHLVLCGTRSERSRIGFLAGTVSERPLRSQRFPVLVLRVM
jgi:hypothetical protein